MERIKNPNFKKEMIARYLEFLNWFKYGKWRCITKHQWITIDTFHIPLSGSNNERIYQDQQVCKRCGKNRH